jgi:hypothetical protein
MAENSAAAIPQVIDVEPVDALRDPAVDEGERT